MAGELPPSCAPASSATTLHLRTTKMSSSSPPNSPANEAAAPPPAFTAVPVRQVFEQRPPTNAPPYYQPLPPPPSTGVATQTKKPTKIEWPQSVRNYVQRSFDPSNSYHDVVKSDVEKKLKEVITHATDQGTLMTTDWDNMPLPQEIVRSDRAHAQAHAAWAAATQMSAVTPISANPNSAAKAMSAMDLDHTPRKRKSQEMSDEAASAYRPWGNTNRMEDRISQPQANKQQAKSSKLQKLEKRRNRFEGGYQSTYKRSPSPEVNTGPIRGTCQQLEKNYLRLTAPPVPSAVRPESILRQTLDLLKTKWKKERNYNYICNQFKSMRQDLTVQRIKNEFTVNVYEIHARIALEKGDLGEYNQCQTQLRSLYAQNLGGHPVEFKAYRILYFIHTGNRTALNDALADLTPAEKEEAPIRHALSVRSALALGNYHRFFRLYLETPNMGAYLMDMFVVRERLLALSKICKGYVFQKPNPLCNKLTFSQLLASRSEVALHYRGTGFRIRHRYR